MNIREQLNKIREKHFLKNDEELIAYLNSKLSPEINKITYGNFRNWFNPERGIPHKYKHLVQNELYSSFPLKEDKKIVSIRYFPDIYASAGFGNANANENFQLINIDKAFLTDVLGVPYKTQYDMIKIYGESMEPFIQNGSFVIVDTSKNSLDKIKNADVAIFRYDGELFCKRIRKNVLDDEIIISSDNIGFEDKKIKKSALKDYVFLGVVICSCNTKIFLNQIEMV